MKRTVWLLVTVVALGATSAAWSQTPPPLADVAKKEAERRKAIKSPGKVYTNEDVAKTKGTMTSAAPVAPAVAPASAQAAPVAEPEPSPEPPRDEAYWRARMADARERLRRSQLFADSLQTRINALTADFTRWDDPYQRAAIGQQRADALAELDRVKREIDALTQEIADIEEEARRAGVPPGWLR
jgi:hypothetical protein